jgi:2-polyprenyl-3-methyl-5-hydroxy-6-metoxy-1,4-benzoquinol methylase
MSESGESSPNLREYWERHYDQVFAEGNPWLDFSNECVQIQTFGLCLEASGTVHRKRCLDLGCGNGQFARILWGCGARVTASDAIETGIQANRKGPEDVTWIVGNLLDEDFLDALPTYERIFMVEVLQYVPFARVIQRVWSKVEPGGRLVGVVPNGDCPIVRNTSARFSGLYAAPSPDEVLTGIKRLAEVEISALRGMTFQSDQRIDPYRVSEWDESTQYANPPNRLQFVVIKQVCASS